MMRYIRLKSNPNIVLASGYVGPGGLGEFDPELYEEVEGELPEGWQQYREPTLLDRLKEIFNSMDDDIRGVFLPSKTSVWLELGAEDPDMKAVEAHIRLTPLPPGAEELEAVRAVLLDAIRSHKEYINYAGN